MADERPYDDELRIPISVQVTLPPGTHGLGRPVVPPYHGEPNASSRMTDNPAVMAANYRRHAAAADAAAVRETRRLYQQLTITAAANVPPLPKGVALAELATIVSEGVARVVAVAALPEVLAALTAAGLVSVIIAGVSYLFATVPAARRWARALVDSIGQAEQLPMADPLPPLPPMQAGPELPIHTGQSTPTIRLPALPPGAPPVVLPSVLPGFSPQPAAPTIMESRSGTPPSRSARARAAARHSDPAVAGTLAEADWRAHHLINLANTRRNDPVIAAATRAGWRPDAPANVGALPGTPDARERLRQAGISRPVHDSGHGDWNAFVLERLSEIKRDLDKEFGSSPSPEKDREALTALEHLQNDLRQRMLKQDRMTMGKDDDSPKQA